MIDFLVTLGGISLAMSVVIIVMLALRDVINKHFTAGCRYILWSIIIIRLCIPFSFDLIPDLITIPKERVEMAVTQTHSVIEDKQSSFQGVQGENSVPVEQNTSTEPTVKTGKSFRLTREHIITALFGVWLLGVFTFIIITLVNYVTNARSLDRSLIQANEEIENRYIDLCAAEGIRRIPPIYISTLASSPMVYGFIKPKVILPDMDIEGSNLDCILRHELVHYTRHDLAVKLLAMLANAIHWFNPLVYMACVRLSSEMELSCDEQALELRSEAQRLDYGSSMLEIVKRCKGVPKLTTGFNPRKKAVKERFENIIELRHRSRGYVLVVIALAAAFLAGGLIGFASAPKVKNEIPKQADDTVINDKLVDDGYYEYSSNDADWEVFYDVDHLVLKHRDGRRFNYSERSKGDYLIEFSPYGDNEVYVYILYDDYALIKYDMLRYDMGDEIREGLVAVELKGGRIVHRLELTSEKFIECHALPSDIFMGYTSTEGYAPGYKIRIADIQQTSALIQPVYVFLETDDGQYTLSLGTSFDRENGLFTEINPCQGIDFYPVNAVTDIAYLDRMEGIDPGAVECVTAFIKKDIKVLTRIGGYYDGQLNDFETLKFGDYTISRVSGDKLRLDVEILLSGVDGLDKGKHTFVYQNFFTCYMEHCCGHYSHIESNKAVDFAEDWMMVNGYPAVPFGLSDSKRYLPEKYKMFKYLAYKYPELDAEGYNEKSRKIFGTDLNVCFYLEENAEVDRTPNFEGYWLGEDGIIYTDRPNLSRGGYYSVYDVLETTVDGDIQTATIQFYNDFGKTLKACKMVFKVRIDVDDVCLTSAPETVEDSGRGILHISI